MAQEKLFLKKPMRWTEIMGPKVFDSTLKPKTKALFGAEIKIGTFSPHTSVHIVSKYGWLNGFHGPDWEAENFRKSKEYEAIVQSGKQGEWYGQGPWTRGLFYRVPQKYEGKFVKIITIEFTEWFIRKLRNKGINRRKDVIALLINPNPKKIEQIPIEFGSLYCPEWDDDHPAVLAWLEEWKWAVEIEEETGFNPMFDF
jgi:hypothetical protein